MQHFIWGLQFAEAVAVWAAYFIVPITLVAFLVINIII